MASRHSKLPEPTRPTPMILPGILFLGMAIVLLVLYVFINTAFDYIFGHIGAFLVCLVSFGRIRMAPLSGGGVGTCNVAWRSCYPAIDVWYHLYHPESMTDFREPMPSMMSLSSGR